MDYYIVEIDSYESDTTAREQLSWERSTSPASVGRLFTIVRTDSGGASVVDDGYRSREEAAAAWPEAR